jgi:4'-phosphopantetheinyl transferase
MGLAIPLEQFSFLLDRPPPIGIRFDPRLEDDPGTWQFELVRPGPDHMMAMGVRRGSRPDLRIRIRRTVPLLD